MYARHVKALSTRGSENHKLDPHRLTCSGRGIDRGLTGAAHDLGMQRLRFLFPGRRRGHPMPTWRSRPYHPSVDIRLSAIHALAPPEPAEQPCEEPAVDPGRRLRRPIVGVGLIDLPTYPMRRVIVRPPLGPSPTGSLTDAEREGSARATRSAPMHAAAVTPRMADLAHRLQRRYQSPGACLTGRRGVGGV